METQTVQRQPSTVVIPDAHQDAAHRYIAAVVGRHAVASLGDAHRDARANELWDQFTGTYADLSTGGYARHGADALRIALGRL